MEVKDSPHKIGQNKYSELGKMKILMLRMCKPIFGIEKAVVLDSGFYVAKGITDLEAKVVIFINSVKKDILYSVLSPPVSILYQV